MSQGFSMRFRWWEEKCEEATKSFLNQENKKTLLNNAKKLDLAFTKALGRLGLMSFEGLRLKCLLHTVTNSCKDIHPIQLLKKSLEPIISNSFFFLISFPFNWAHSIQCCSNTRWNEKDFHRFPDSSYVKREAAGRGVFTTSRKSYRKIIESIRITCRLPTRIRQRSWFTQEVINEKLV